MSEAKTPPAGMRAVTKKSALPIYAIGAVWLLWALLFPLYSLMHFALCGLVSLAAYLILSKVIPDSVVYEKIPVLITGYDSADALLKAGDAHLESIAALSAKIENAKCGPRRTNWAAPASGSLTMSARIPKVPTTCASS